MTSVIEAVPDHASKVSHLQEIIGRTLAAFDCSRRPGRRRACNTPDRCYQGPRLSTTTRFRSELATIVENSFNIHQDGARLVFKEEENPQAKVMASARNDKLFTDGSDLAQLAKEIRYVIGGSEEVAKMFRVIALPRSWLDDPWTGPR